MHALAALLRNNPSITELNVRANAVTDEGARALAAVLAGPCALRSVDLRENHVGKSGVRAIAEALERSKRVRHVYVHAGGKIEALGTGLWAAPRGDLGPDVAATMSAGAGGGTMAVETVCAVDVRDNTEPPPPDYMMEEGAGGTFGLTGGGGGPETDAPLSATAGAGAGAGAGASRTIQPVRQLSSTTGGQGSSRHKSPARTGSRPRTSGARPEKKLRSQKQREEARARRETKRIVSAIGGQQ